MVQRRTNECFPIIAIIYNSSAFDYTFLWSSM